MTSFGQYGEPRHVLAHISDTHLRADSLQYGAIDTRAHLNDVLERVRRISPAPQALIFTGDLADLGEPDAYDRLRDAVLPVAEELGAQVVWTMGNHDDRTAYARTLFGTDSDAPQDAVYDVAGLRIVALDTTVPGWHHGELADEQLTWLADVLATPAPHGTVLAMHHPPIPVPAMPAAALIELHDQHRLAEVVRGSDVRTILGGHFHYPSMSTFAGVTVSVASATCYTMDLLPHDRLLSGVDGHQGFNLVHLDDDRVVHTVVGTTTAPEVTGQGAALAEPLLAMDPQERFVLVARKDSPLYAGE